jgi:predicted exporter
LTRRARVVVLVWLALLAASLLVATRARIMSDFTAFLPARLDADQALLVHQLREGVAARMILIGISGAEPGALAGASRALAQRLSASAQFAYVNNGEARFGAADRAFVERWRYLLSPAVAPARFSPAGLREAMQRALEALGSPLGGMLASSIAADPTGEARRYLESLPAAGPDTRHGVWFSPDGRSALLVAETRAAASDLDAQARAVNEVRAAFAAAAGADKASLTLSGPGVFAVESRALIRADASSLSLIAGAAVLTLLLFVYRSAALTLACFLPIASGILVGVALVALAFGSIHGISLGFAAILFGEAVDYPSYLFLHNQPGDTLRTTLARVWPTLRLAVLTTVLGGLSMLLSSFVGLAQLGLLLMSAILVAGLVTRYVLPEIAPARPVALARLAPLLGWSALARHQRALRALAWSALALVLALGVLRPGALWDDDLGKLNPIPDVERRADQQLRAELKAPDVGAVIVLRAPGREQALERSEALEPALRGLVDDGLIAGYEAASDILPSEALQRARRAALPGARALRDALAQAQRGLPFRPGLFEPFLRDVEHARSGPLLEPADLRGTGLALKLHALLFPLHGEWVALIPLRGANDLAALAARFEALHAPGAKLLDLRRETGRMIARYRGQTLKLTALGVAAMFGLLAWGLGGLREAARVLMPVLLAATVTAGMLPLFGSPLTLFHLVALLFVVGTGLNYSLFFNRVPRDPDERRRTLLSLTVCCLAVLCSAGALALSATPVLRAIGLTVLAGTPLALLFSAAFGRDSV